MTGMIPPAITASEGARRAFLARVEDALTARGIAGLTWAYQATSPAAFGLATPQTILVATLTGVTGEVRVGAVTAVRRMLTTRPGDGNAMLEQLRAQVRQLGVAAVAGVHRTHEPFPGDGIPEYELSILEPAPPDAAGQIDAGKRHIYQQYLTDPAKVADAIAEWAEALTRRTPAGPRIASDLKALRVLAQARRTALAGTDWSQVDAHRSAGHLLETWIAAGFIAGFDPDNPDAAIDQSATGPTKPAVPLAEQLARGFAGSGIEAIID